MVVEVDTLPEGMPAEIGTTDMLAKPVLVAVSVEPMNAPCPLPAGFCCVVEGIMYWCVCPKSVAVCECVPSALPEKLEVEDAVCVCETTMASAVPPIWDTA